MSSQLVAAINAQRLPAAAREILSSPGSTAADVALARRALTTCESIGAQVAAERDRVVGVVRDAGIDVSADDDDGPRQHHATTFGVADVDAADRAVAVLGSHGFESWDRWTNGARTSFRHATDHLTVARTTDATTVVRIAWPVTHRPRPWDRLLRPTAADWHRATLPSWAWRAYPAVRVGRLVAERITSDGPRGAGLGPPLATPDGLLDALFDHAHVTAEDHVVDLGCGDGRIPVASAVRRGCTAVGVEADDELAQQARRRAVEADVADRVTIAHADAREADLSDATVVFVFLPTDVAAPLIGNILPRLQSGARVVMHEQSPLPNELRPDDSTPIVGDAAVSVAHRWTVA